MFRAALLATLPCTASVFAQTTLLSWDGDAGQPQILGTSIAGVGDVDGDGHVDVLIGSPGEGAGSKGAARLYSGADGHELRAWVSAQPGARLGWSVTGVGDVSGDGIPDVLVGAPQGAEYSSQSGRGFANLYSGSNGALIQRFDGEAFGDMYGFWVASLGDLDGDGFREFAIGAPLHDNAESDSGLAEIRSGATLAVLHTFTGGSDYDHLGYCIDDSGDVDADGTPDVIVGLPSEYGEIEGGHARVFSGATGGQLLEFEGGGYDRFLGKSVSGAGDVNLDGHADLLVGMPGANGVRVYSGATGAVLYALSGKPQSGFGNAVDAAGDLDGDGFPDLLIAARSDGPHSEFGPYDRGSVSFFSGRDGSQLWKVIGDLGSFGYAASFAGDIDGDGRSDLVVGEPQYYSFGVGDTGRAHAFTIHPWLGLGSGLAGTGGLPTLWGHGLLEAGQPMGLRLADAKAAAPTTLVIGLTALNLPFKGGVLVPNPDMLVFGLATDSLGELSLSALWPSGVPASTVIRFQAWIVDAVGPLGLSASNGVSVVTP